MDDALEMLRKLVLRRDDTELTYEDAYIFLRSSIWHEAKAVVASVAPSSLPADGEQG